MCALEKMLAFPALLLTLTACFLARLAEMFLLAGLDFDRLTEIQQLALVTPHLAAGLLMSFEDVEDSVTPVYTACYAFAASPAKLIEEPSSSAHPLN